MPERNKKYITTWSGELYVKVDERFYKHFPDDALVEKKDIQRIFEETNDAEMAVYDCCCRCCKHAKWCHEECENRCADDEDATFVQMTRYVEEEI